MAYQVSYDTLRLAARIELNATKMKSPSDTADQRTYGYVVSSVKNSSTGELLMPMAYPTVVKMAWNTRSQIAPKPTQRCASVMRSCPKTWSSHGLRDMRMSWMRTRYVPY